MSTFNDNLEEMREHLLENDLDNDDEEKEKPKINLRRIIRNGVGDVTPTDVLVAHSAKG